MMLASALASGVFAQTSASVSNPDGQSLRKGEYTFAAAYSNLSNADVQNAELNSKLMGRKMPYRIILPAGYQTSNDKVRYPVIYLLHGLSGHFDNWTDKTKVAADAANFNFIIVTPEGGDGWYTDSATVPTDKFESYIVKELVPEIDKKYRTQSDRAHRMIAGLSMGGYGSLKFGLKYPEMFSLVGSFSGAVGATSYDEKHAGPAIAKSLAAIFGAEGSELRGSNDIFKMISDLTPDKLKAIPYIYQSCGTEDFLFQDNRNFLQLLVEKKVPHEYREHPGVHDWIFWDDQVREFLKLAYRRLASGK
jgi:S-formylglutathione hydrolase FrmB